MYNQLLLAKNSMSIIPAVATTFFLGIFALAVITYLRVNAEYRKNRKSPVTTQKAKLIQKRIEVKGHKNPDKDPKDNPTARLYHVLRFRLENGAIAEYDVEEQVYEQYEEGSKGLLRYQGTWFKGFEPKLIKDESEQIAERK